MKLTQKLKNAAVPIWNKIYNTPFVEELCKGTLPHKKFRFFVIHDYNYLIASIKNFSILAAKANSVNNMQLLSEIAREEAKTELGGYKNYLKQLEIPLDEVVKAEPTFLETSYTNFLLSASLMKSFAEGITAVLPCYWTYSEIAKFHKENIINNPNKIYREWASLYLDEEYLLVVDKIKTIVNKIDPEFSYAKLEKIFIQSSKYELLFWQAAYKMEEWPL